MTDEHARLYVHMELTLTTEQKEVKVMRPQGVYSCWHVAGIAGLTALLVSVAMSNSGFFYVGFIDLFGVGREDASWPSSAYSAVTQLGGTLILAYVRIPSILFHSSLLSTSSSSLFLHFHHKTLDGFVQ